MVSNREGTFLRNIDDCFGPKKKSCLTADERDRINRDIDGLLHRVEPNQSTMDLLMKAFAQIQLAIEPMLGEFDLVVYGSAANGLFEAPNLLQ